MNYQEKIKGVGIQATCLSFSRFTMCFPGSLKCLFLQRLLNLKGILCVKFVFVRSSQLFLDRFSFVIIIIIIIIIKLKRGLLKMD